MSPSFSGGELGEFPSRRNWDVSEGRGHCRCHAHEQGAAVSKASACCHVSAGQILLISLYFISKPMVFRFSITEHCVGLNAGLSCLQLGSSKAAASERRSEASRGTCGAASCPAKILH